jgi:hypothetical protein
MARVFFSSCFEDPRHEPLHIRARVKALNAKTSKKHIWMAEDFAALDQSASSPALEKALFCVNGVRESDTYVAVITHRHGSGVHFSTTQQAQASYFELELYEAAVLRKPSYVFLLKGFEPEKRLASLLDLLAPALPGFCREPLEEDEILTRVERLLIQQSRSAWVRKLSQAAAGAPVINRFTASRYRQYDPRSEQPTLRFLDGMMDPYANAPDIGTVKDLLERAAQEGNHNSKLAITWMAIRELMGAPPTASSDKQLVELWDRALSAWNIAGAWFGHRAPLYGMPCLAGIAFSGADSREPVFRFAAWGVGQRILFHREANHGRTAEVRNSPNLPSAC